jgi:hypothetical protein
VQRKRLNGKQHGEDLLLDGWEKQGDTLKPDVVNRPSHPGRPKEKPLKFAVADLSKSSVDESDLGLECCLDTRVAVRGNKG